MLISGQVRLVETDAIESFRQHAFEVGDLDNPASLIPLWRHIAHFGEREQPFILWVVVGNSMKQVYILHRRQPLNFEVREPPYVKSLAHHGVQPTIKLFFLVAVLSRAVGEVLGACYAQAFACGAHCHDDAPQRAEEQGGARPVQYASYLLLRCLRLP